MRTPLTHRLVLYLKRPFKFDVLSRLLADGPIRILDVGCGNHSPLITKRYFPNCIYYGLDRHRDYNLDDHDMQLMDKFIELDLAHPEQINPLPDSSFDCIILSHVIEHLENGEAVLAALTPKLANGGILYLEFPSPHTVYLPRITGLCPLNFYEDPSHVRMYTVRKLDQFLQGKGYQILKSGLRMSLKGILLIPFYLLRSMIFRRHLGGAVFWDLTAFASYTVAQKR